ncbi:MAG: site-specific integrase [Oscillospiraceae bacterium]|nr:site-specific integrase [Oscillospiraceae bacterium]
MCDLPKVIKKDIRPLEKDDISLFLNAIRGHEFEYLYQITLFTGLRQGEVLGLTWDCVDFEHKTLYINKQLQKDQKIGGKYALVPTKNSRSRIVTAVDPVMAVLRKVKQEQTRKKEIADAAWSNPWNLVFTNDFGGHLCHFTVYHRFKDIVRGIGLDNARFHDLRHSYAVVSIESGDDIKTVQSNLGHATASFTLDVYGHVSQKMRQQSADRMERFIQALPVPVSI